MAARIDMTRRISLRKDQIKKIRVARGVTTKLGRAKWRLSFWELSLFLDLRWLPSRGSFGIRVHSKVLVATDKMSPGPALSLERMSIMRIMAERTKAATALA
jgi:hypothetical protein